MKVEFVPKGEWVEHYEVLEKTIIGWMPLMTFHPMSGDRPMMFDTAQLAEKYINDVHQITTDKQEALENAIDFASHKILFFPKNKDWLEHYEVWDKSFFIWSPIMTSHPQTGDKPYMFDSLEEAKKYIEVHILQQSPNQDDEPIVTEKSQTANRIANSNRRIRI